MIQVAVYKDVEIGFSTEYITDMANMLILYASGLSSKECSIKDCFVESGTRKNVENRSGICKMVKTYTLIWG